MPRFSLWTAAACGKPQKRRCLRFWAEEPVCRICTSLLLRVFHLDEVAGSLAAAVARCDNRAWEPLLESCHDLGRILAIVLDRFRVQGRTIRLDKCLEHCVLL